MVITMVIFEAWYNLELDIEHIEEVQRVKTDQNVKMLEKFRVDYIEQNFEHLDLDFKKYSNCDSNAQTNDEMSDEAIADFCLKNNDRRSRRRRNG